MEGNYYSFEMCRLNSDDSVLFNQFSKEKNAFLICECRAALQAGEQMPNSVCSLKFKRFEEIFLDLDNIR